MSYHTTIKLLYKCPYCERDFAEYINTYGSGPNAITCDQDDGGCGGLFVVDVPYAHTIETTTRGIEGEKERIDNEKYGEANQDENI